MESRGRTEGERGILSEKMSSETCKEGSAKEGDVTGLRGGEVTGGGLGPSRGGNSESVNKEGITK